MNAAEKFWNMLASRYDAENEDSDGPRSRLIEKTKKYLKPGDAVLDYGCATGGVTVEIAGSVKTVHGLDISPKMIALAAERAAACQIDNVDFTAGSIFDERFKGGSFDAILAFNILHLLEDAQKAARRIHELLKPGGMFITTTPCIGERYSILYVPFIVFAWLFGIPRVRFFKFAQLEALIASGDFEIVETKHSKRDAISYFIAARKK